MARTYYPSFYQRKTEFQRWLANHKDLLEQAVGITAGSSQDAQLTALQNALNAISPANGWPIYKEGV